MPISLKLETLASTATIHVVTLELPSVTTNNSVNLLPRLATKAPGNPPA